MLVLSRKESERILFPSLGISVEVLRVQGRKVRLGIDAPVDVPIVRHELATLKDVEFSPEPPKQSDRLRELVFAIRNRLDTTATRLNQLHSSLDPAGGDYAQSLIDEMYGELQSLEKEANRVLEDSGVQVNSTPQALLVEDSAAERKLLEAYLEMCGFNVTTAADGRDALDYLSLHARPDVVLLDMMMPRIDGAEFIRQVRSDPTLNGLCIFAITSMDPDEVALPTGPTGVDRWYSKPVNPKALVHDVALYLTSQAAVA